MNKETLEKIKEKLFKEREEIRTQLSSFAKEDVSQKDNFHTEFPKYGDKEDDNATEVATFQDNLSLEKKLEQTLAEINQALENMEKGEYGICKKCGHPIEEKRLEIMPTATTCIKDKENGG